MTHLNIFLQSTASGVRCLHRHPQRLLFFEVLNHSISEALWGVHPSQQQAAPLFPASTLRVQ